MKKYLIITFILIFGIAILSTYITYKKTNSEDIIDNRNLQNINQIQTSDKQITSELADENIAQRPKEITKRNLGTENKIEVKNKHKQHTIDNLHTHFFIIKSLYNIIYLQKQYISKQSNPTYRYRVLFHCKDTLQTIKVFLKNRFSTKKLKIRQITIKARPH